MVKSGKLHEIPASTQLKLEEQCGGCLGVPPWAEDKLQPPPLDKGGCQGIDAVKASFLPEFGEETKLEGLGMWKVRAQTTPTAHPKREAFPALL